MGLGNHLIYWFPNTCSCGPPCLNVGFSRNIHIFFMWVDFPFSRGSSQTRDQTKPGLLRCRQILYQLSHRGSPRILEWVAYPFSRGSSRPRNWTRVSCIADGFFTIRATREAHGQVMNPPSRVNWKTTTPAHCLRPAMTPVPWQILYWIWSLCQEAVEAWTFQSIWAIKTPTRQMCAYHHVVSYV